MSGAADGGNVIGLFAAAADRRRSAPAIVDADGRVLWSFEALADMAARLAGGLARAGLGPGDRVLVLERDPRRRFAVIAGVLWAGATVTAPPASLPGKAALAAIASARPSAVVFDPGLWPLILGTATLRAVPLWIVTGGPRPRDAWSLDRLAEAAAVGPCDVPGDLPALASFTSGSSGPPQLVLRSQDLLRAQHAALGQLRTLGDDDRDLVGLPFLALHDLGAGVTCVLPPATPGVAEFGARVRQAVARAGATSAAGFPALFGAAARGGEPMRGLRSIHVGGSRVPAGLLVSLARAAPGAGVTVVYGSTEAEPIASIGAGEYLEALASGDPDEGVCAGRVVQPLDLQIAPDGGQGEVLVRGPRAVPSPGRDGWTATGDAGRFDGDGRLWLLGRIANAAGGRYPFQVERAVESLEWVQRAALVRIGAGPVGRALVVAEPRHWDARASGAWAASIRNLALEKGWSTFDVRLVRKLPVLPGPAAKVDTQRLARGVAPLASEPMTQEA